MDKDKKIKDAYKQVYNKIEPSEELKRDTSMKMKSILNKREEKKSVFPSARPTLAALCLMVVVVGGGILKLNYNGITSPNVDSTPDTSKKLPPDEQPMGKIKVNISGVVEEVADGGKSFRIGDMWVRVDENTKYYSFSGEVRISRVFEVGNRVEGFTDEDISGKNVRAYAIYKND